METRLRFRPSAAVYHTVTTTFTHRVAGLDPALADTSFASPLLGQKSAAGPLERQNIGGTPDIRFHARLDTLAQIEMQFQIPHGVNGGNQIAAKESKHTP